MNSNQRNGRIYEIHKAHPSWTYQDIGELVGLSRQRVQQIVRQIEDHGIIDSEMETRNDHRFTEPISATQAAKQVGIPRWTIEKWIQRGLVKVLEHPGHTAPGKPVLLDPITLQERIDRYQPRRNRAAV